MIGEIVCGICIYGDGRWRERLGQKLPDLPPCKKCKSDGWSGDPVEIVEAFKKDINFNLGIKSPYDENS